MTNGWTIKNLAEELIGHTAVTKPEAREVIWASELSMPFIDRFLKMKGIPYTNPVDGKGLAKFFLGKQIEEGLVGMLTTCGIAYEGQDKLTVKTPGCLDVEGKPDIILEVTDWNKVVAKIDDQIKTLEKENTPDNKRPIRKKKSLRELVLNWQERYPDGLYKTVFEVKSLNSWAFKYNKEHGGLSNAYPHHKLQLYTYMKGLKLDEGHIIYIARDTGFMEEIVIKTNKRLKKMWLDDVQTMSKYFTEDKRPPREPIRDEKGKVNWKVNYSRYKDMIYPELTKS
jgi:hypothetical protein